jgi:hypothetical protein
MVAEELKKLMTSGRVTVNIHHMRDVRSKEPAPADLYVLNSPGGIGKPISSMQRFLKKTMLLPGPKHAILTTGGALRPNKKTGKMPADEEIAKLQRVRPAMNEMLLTKRLRRAVEGPILARDIKGPHEEGWRKKVEESSKAILESS